MSESTLPYLEKIAKAIDKMNSDGSKKQSEALQSISKNIGTYNVTSQTVNMGTQENTKEIADAVKKGLITEVIEGQGSSAHEVEKGILDVMKEAFVQVFREAMFTVVGTGSSAQEVSIFKVISDTLSDIKTAQQGIEAALSGTGSAGSISSQLSAIETTLGTMDTSLGTMNTAIGTMNTTIGNVGTDVGNIKSDVAAIKSQTDDLESSIGQFTSGDTDSVRTKLTQIKSTADSINTKLADIKDYTRDTDTNTDAINSRMKDYFYPASSRGTVQELLYDIKGNTQ